MAAVQRSTGQEICPALAGLWHTHHRSLVRLAALLTGDSGAAETVVLDSFVALHRLRRCGLARDDALRSLRRLVVTLSRRAEHGHPLAGGVQGPPSSGTAGHGGAARLEGHRRPAGAEGHSGTTATGSQGGATGAQGRRPAVVTALQALPAAQREAIVLTLYLDLGEQEAAAAMRVSPAALRRHLALARAALRAALPVSPA